MNSRFVRYGNSGRRNDREKLMVIGAAGLAVSLLIGIVFIISYRSEASTGQQQVNDPVAAAPAAIGTVRLLAPETSVPIGAKLSNVALKEMFWPRNQVPPGAIRDIADVVALFAKENLPAGVPITRDKLSTTPVQGSLHLKQGFRAVTIEGDASMIVEGHVTPGSKVDVLLTYLKVDTRTTKIIVQNATVLSLGGKVEIPENNFGGVIVPSSSTVTLEVTPTDALKIQTAKTMGRLSLILRPAEDVLSPAVTEVDQNEMDDSKNRNKLVTRGTTCSKGTVKVGDTQISVGCDGRLTQMINSEEP